MNKAANTAKPAAVSKLKQLKKNDFLEVITEAPMSRGQLVEALEDFEFIGSYLDYLTDHFVAQNKIIRNEDGTVQRKVKASGGASRELFRVVTGEDDYSMEQRVLGKGEYYNDSVKELGWAQTPNAAIKKATSAVFQQYKEDTAAIKALIGK